MWQEGCTSGPFPGVPPQQLSPSALLSPSPRLGFQALKVMLAGVQPAGREA